MPNELPKKMPKAGGAGKVTRVMKIRAPGKVNQHVLIAIRMGIRF
jgi:hypothetical protein